MAIQMYSYFKKDTIFASDLYVIYKASPSKSHTDRPLILYLLLRWKLQKLPSCKPKILVNKKDEKTFQIIFLLYNKVTVRPNKRNAQIVNT